MRRCRARMPVCPRFQHAAELVGRRWTAAVIRVTLDGPARFGEIRSSVPGISARLLSERLRELEAEGLVVRRPPADGAGPPEYALTGKGRALVDVVRALEAWVDSWQSAGAPAPGTAGAGPRGPAPDDGPARGSAPRPEGD